ncbi:NADPH:adrenodoxin oxidoreductase [Purpureocillium lilacinum]|nr:NADPH:adrenodoxin oxidoreductase [Purpureocillium lilacinum]OAQ86553.1 NADPH:adrenodoxin oxidoreductase [Purpureocillium lilacinum]OAQ94514.1 NADPH:adrenodoxin oxidoreductase [Purpureocillium lilacinum]GJN67215.1 NADPH-adrenodoxin reductase [Purpureocillium lilacinum]GJN81124.1 NADPH-adrenodoxin reductase [Purpureocillium lilacinum]
MRPAPARTAIGGGVRAWSAAAAPATPTPPSPTALRPPRDAASSPMRLAVVGSGPAGFYAASRVMSRLPGARVDMYEGLPVPFGLVRHGVAPDHPEVKNCQDRFGEIASASNFRFLGNVSVGQPVHAADHCTVPLRSLMRHYDTILLAYGASEDKKLGIPGESTLTGIYSARQFVGWYNGLPECAGLQPDLLRGEDAVVVGQGNVALDVARILLEDVDVLRKTDITERALAELARSRVRRVHVVARRGPMQAAFTIKEVRELMKLPGVAFWPANRALIPEDIKSLPRASRRLMEVLLKGTSLSPGQASRSWSLDSCLSPRHFLGRQDDPTAVAGTEFDVTHLQDPFDPASRVVNTGTTKILPSDVVFRSVGYRSVALPEFAEAGIQFDTKRGIVDNDGLGRVIRLVSDGDATPHVKTQQVAGLYCAGWLKRGPTGVIASTMQDAFATGDAIVQDWLSGGRFLQPDQGQSPGGWEAVVQDVGPSATSAVSWDQWLRIDAAEKGRGHRLGKEREKFTSTIDMLSVL